MVAFFLAATVVTLSQYLRLHDRRLLPLAVQFALTATAHFVAEGGFMSWPLHVAAGGAGLVLLYMLSPRRPASR
ncbi:MAG: hypothetical protein JXO72_06055 [Vicinamibacteria bacterium]|nr:hypothetical protein [Vicinamibacteria bacterium]